MCSNNSNEYYTLFTVGGAYFTELPLRWNSHCKLAAQLLRPHDRSDVALRRTAKRYNGAFGQTILNLF